MMILLCFKFHENCQTPWFSLTELQGLFAVFWPGSALLTVQKRPVLLSEFWSRKKQCQGEDYFKHLNMKCIKAAFETADGNSVPSNMLEPLHKLQSIWSVVAKLKILILHLKEYR